MNDYRNLILIYVNLSIFLTAFAYKNPWHLMANSLIEVRLFYVQIEENFTLTEALKRCVTLNMVTSFYFEDLSEELEQDKKYWAPFSYFPQMDNNKMMHPSNTSGVNEVERKFVICATALRGAMMIYQNGSSRYVNFNEPFAEVPLECFPQRDFQESEIDGNDLQMCLLIKETENQRRIKKKTYEIS